MDNQDNTNDCVNEQNVQENNEQQNEQDHQNNSDQMNLFSSESDNEQNNQEVQIVEGDEHKQPYKLKQPLPDSSHKQFWIKTLHSASTDRLCSEEFQKVEFDQVCCRLEQWSLRKQFCTYGCKIPQMLLLIKNINFPNLKSINIWDNSIASIEFIHEMSVPVLEQLWIWSNKIMSIKPLRRVNLPHLNVIDIKQNVINDHQSLCQLWVPKKKIYRIDVGSDKDSIALDIRWMSKMECTISSINLSGNYLKINNQVAQKIKKG